jgi:hypothetical protein
MTLVEPCDEVLRQMLTKWQLPDAISQLDTTHTWV